MKTLHRFTLTLLAAAGISSSAFAQDTHESIAISGWTGFAPLTLAEEAGVFKKNGAILQDWPITEPHCALPTLQRRTFRDSRRMVDPKI